MDALKLALATNVREAMEIREFNLVPDAERIEIHKINDLQTQVKVHLKTGMPRYFIVQVREFII